MVRRGTIHNTSFSRKQRRRLPPYRGIEQLVRAGAAAPRSPSQQAASDPTATSQYEPSMNPDDDDDDDDNGGDDEDSGEGTMRKAPSIGSGGTSHSAEMIPDSEYEPSPTSPTKRGSNEPASTKVRTEEPPAVVEEGAEKVPKISKVKGKVRLPSLGFTDSEAEERRANMVIRTLSDDDPMSTSSTSSEFRVRIRRGYSLKSVKDVEKFLKTEDLRYNDDEEVDIEEFEGVEAEIGDDEEFFEYDNDDKFESEGPTWSHDFEEGPPKLSDEELAEVDKQSRKTELERLTDMKVLKAISEEAKRGDYK